MVLAVYSGGLDSTVMLKLLASRGELKEAVCFDYGQRHSKEMQFAKMNCDELGIPLKVINLKNIGDVFADNALTCDKLDVPEGDYADENMKTTVVPNRNMVMLSIAAARAIATDCDSLAYAAHGGDHAIYPDCRTEFADAMQNALALCHYTPIKLLRPFIDMNKADIVKLGAKLGVDFNKTWSCYCGRELHCGKCGTCLERRQAFAQAQIPDPTKYLL